MRQITPEHLAFVDEAARAFEENPRFETYLNDENRFIALRYGLDRDCIMVYELGDEVALFAQQVNKRYPAMRKEVYAFAREMEAQLRANEYKGGWENSSERFLLEEMYRNANALLSPKVSCDEYRRRCANIANFVMMLADNKRRATMDRL